MPRIISAACSAFIRRGGVTCCEVTGARQYSADLSQGGMEVPCKLTFTAPLKEIDKLHIITLLPRADFKEISFLTNNLDIAVVRYCCEIKWNELLSNIFEGEIFTNGIQFAKFVKNFPLKNNLLYGS